MRAMLLATTLLAAVAWCGACASAAEPDDVEVKASELITPATSQAVDEGLKFLASRQAEDGSFGPGGPSRNVAICALAGMAFLSSGSTPSRGPYGSEVEKCVDFLLAHTDSTGFINLEGAATHGPMYGHGFATLFLAETYGMTRRGEIRDKLADAVKLIVGTQNQEGGWRYQPRRHDADISVTICQVMALRAARNAGLHVPRETIDHCIDYVKRSQNPDGGFMYMLTGGDSAFPRSAAGVVALYSAGIYEGPEVTKGLEYLMHHLPRGDAFSRETHYFYGHYYAVQAMWHAGGKHWKSWYPAIRDELLSRQHADGSWMDSICVEYGTAMACIVLQMPNNYLPIFQR
ncbi:MAG: terpene cyclase/mutase family protein [Pirellulales bacterium]|nr:terpene cyclase/mutase family protein [Pirellulales bacterium]